MNNSRTNIGPGLLGFCDLIHDAMVEQGYGGTLDELRMVSGAALQHYIYEPAFNRHEETPREFSRLALLFNNYGFFESIRYFTSWNVRDFDRVPMADALSLITHELSQGRGLISVDLDGTLEPALIVGIRESREISAAIRAGDGIAPKALDLTGRSNLQTDESFQNFVVMVRPGDGEQALVGPNRQKLELIHWTMSHHKADKEFFHETRENYAPGDRAWQRLEELAVSPDPQTQAYLDDHLTFLEIGRRAAANVLPKWAIQLGDAVGSDELTTAIAQAAKLYGEVADAISDGEIARARAAERQAIRTFVGASEHFPGRFQPLD